MSEPAAARAKETRDEDIFVFSLSLCLSLSLSLSLSSAEQFSGLAQELEAVLASHAQVPEIRVGMH